MNLFQLLDLDPREIKQEADRVYIEECINRIKTNILNLKAAGDIEEEEFKKSISKFNSIKAKFKNQRIKDGLLTKESKELFVDTTPSHIEGHTLIYFDGSISKNPGGLAVGGCVLYYKDGTKYKHYLTQDNSTNNVAEYLGLIAAFELSLHLNLTKLFIKGDSNLVIKQVNGQAKVNPGRLFSLNSRAEELKQYFESVQLMHIRRFFNKEADKFVYKKMKDLTS